MNIIFTRLGENVARSAIFACIFEKSSFFVCFSSTLSDFRMFFAHEMLSCGDLKPSSNTVGTRSCPWQCVALADRHFRPIVLLVCVLSWVWVRVTAPKTSHLQTLYLVLRSLRPIIEAGSVTEQLVVYKRPSAIMLPSFMRIGVLEISFLVVWGWNLRELTDKIVEKNEKS